MRPLDEEAWKSLGMGGGLVTVGGDAGSSYGSFPHCFLPVLVCRGSLETVVGGDESSCGGFLHGFLPVFGYRVSLKSLWRGFAVLELV